MGNLYVMYGKGVVWISTGLIGTVTARMMKCADHEAPSMFRFVYMYNMLSTPKAPRLEKLSRYCHVHSSSFVHTLYFNQESKKRQVLACFLVVWCTLTTQIVFHYGPAQTTLRDAGLWWSCGQSHTCMVNDLILTGDRPTMLKQRTGIMEADDRFTVQPSFHHRHSTSRVSWSVTIVGERAVTLHLVVRRRW